MTAQLGIVGIAPGLAASSLSQKAIEYAKTRSIGPATLGALNAGSGTVFFPRRLNAKSEAVFFPYCFGGERVS